MKKPEVRPKAKSRKQKAIANPGRQFAIASSQLT